MAYVRSFTGYAPPPRYDSVPFSSARIQESADKETWNTVETVALTVDPDPAVPAARNLTTDQAALESAWYRIVWVDGNGSTFTSDPAYFPEALRPGAIAHIDDVARLLRISISGSQEPDVLAALETAESWARTYLRQPDLGGDGAIASFYDVSNDGWMPVSAAPLSVSVVDFAGAAARELADDMWTYEGAGVRLRPTDTFVDPRFADEAFPRTYVRVDIATGPDEAIDPVIRDGVALAAGALWTRSPRLTKGLTGENIGDYSYTVAQLEDGDPFFAQARSMLRPLRSQESLVP